MTVSNQVAEASVQYLSEAAGQVVPVGYKQTEVGVIPEDWDLRQLGKVFEFKNGLNKEKEYFGYGSPIINYMDVYRFVGINEKNVTGKVFVNPVEQKNYSAKKGDVFFTRTSETIEEIGLASVLLEEIQGAVFSGFLLRARQKVELFVSNYAKYCFRSQLSRKQIQGTASYTTRALTNGSLLSNVLIPIPHHEEQTAIANVLSDVDALINELEKLIAKKQAIKTATMQQLLSGRTRLPQYALREDGTQKGYKQSELGEIPEDWDVIPLGEITEKIVGGGTPSRTNPAYWGNEIPWVTVKDFATFNPYSAQEFITKLGLQKSASNLISKGILITSTRMALGKAVVYQVDVAINQDLKAIFPSESLTTKYLYYWFDFNSSIIDELGSGSTVKGLSLSDLRAMMFILPPKQEQTAIATILSDMDADIQTLQQRLSKTRQIKKGMMQELLTGRIRLVSGE